MASYRKDRKTRVYKKRRQPSYKKTPRKKILPKRKQLLKRKSRATKRVTKKVLNKKTEGKKMMGKKSGGKKAESRYHILKSPYDEFVAKVLRKLHKEKVPISTKAKGRMISFIRCLYNDVSKNVKSGKRSKPIGSLEIQNALKRVMRKKPAMEMVRAIRNVPHQH